MSERQARAWRQRQERKRRWLWESSPLPASDKLYAIASAEYMARTLRGVQAEPPPQWTAEMVQAWQAVLESPPDRAAALAWALGGMVRVEQEFAATEQGHEGG